MDASSSTVSFSRAIIKGYMKKPVSKKSPAAPPPPKPRKFKKSSPPPKQTKQKKKETVVFKQAPKTPRKPLFTKPSLKLPWRKTSLPKSAKQTPVAKPVEGKPIFAKAMVGKQFPKIPRFIPEFSFPKHLNVSAILWRAVKKIAQDKWLTYPITILLFVMGIALIGLDLSRNVLLLQQENQKKNDLLREEAYWKEIVRKHPNYRDAYFELALITYQLKDFASSKQYLEKTMILDPNFGKGQELKVLLEKK